MDVTAVAKFVRLSPQKARDLARRLTGLSVGAALQVTEFSGRKAGAMIGKTLKSAVANAENNAKLSVDELRVKKAVIDDGPSSRRYWARARGGVSPVLRRTCHIRIVLSDDREPEEAPRSEDAGS